MTEKKKLMRITTVPMSFNLLLRHQLGFMNEHYEVIAVASPGEDLEELAQRERIGTRAVVMTRAITPIKDLKALWQLYKLFRKEKPFIIHTLTPKAGLLGMLAGWMAGVPLRMHTVNGLPLLRTAGVKRSVLNTMEKWTYMLAHQVYTNSFGMRNMLLSFKFCGEEKMKVVAEGSSNGIDTTYFDPALFSELDKRELRARLNLSDDDIALCFVGRIVADKGINELVTAFVRLHKELPRLKLILVGWLEQELNPLLPYVYDLVKEHPAIISVGYQKDIRPYLAISRALVFPSHREGFPNVPMQAGAMGIPSIVSNINGCNEIIENDKNGVIIPVRDEQAIYDSMKKMVTDDVFYTSLLPWCRNMIADKFNQQTIWNAMLTEYKELSSKRS